MKDVTIAKLVTAGALGLSSVLIAGLGIAVAASHGGTIHGCVAKSDGALRVVHSSHDCTAKEKALSFNAKGVRGPRGPRGRPGSPGSSSTFQMYANVDQNGNLGSNHDAVSVHEVYGGPPPEDPLYQVTFSKPIESCAAVAQSGFAGGDLEAATYPSTVTPADDDKTFLVGFRTGPSNASVSSAFMLTVTCTS